MIVSVVLLALLAGCGSAPAQLTTVPAVPVKAQPEVDLSAKLLQESAAYLKADRALLISAADVFQKVLIAKDPGYVLVDVRSDEHYAKHHIPGSVHISYADAWRPNKTDFLPRDKKIIVIDYSGHSSAQVVALWQMLGYDAVAMKHGMAGWSTDKDVVGGSTLPCEPRNYPLVKDAVSATSNNLPAVELKATDMADLLRKRAAFLSDKPVVIQADDLNAKLKTTAVPVVDLRSPAHYNAGHIQGAINIPLAQLMEMENLKKISSDQQVVLVCYDGHAAGKASRVLNQLGYNTVSMRDGMSLWSGNAEITGVQPVACKLPTHPTAQLNAPLSPGPSTAAT